MTLFLTCLEKKIQSIEYIKSVKSFFKTLFKAFTKLNVSSLQ